jgi:hypothetical protein
MSKHTPGPWRVGAPGPNGCHTVGTEGGLMTAMVAHSINHPEQASQAIADARLIAAAPELLEALQAILNSVPFHHGHKGAHDAAVAAIAKATNGSTT